LQILEERRKSVRTLRESIVAGVTEDIFGSRKPPTEFKSGGGIRRRGFATLRTPREKRKITTFWPEGESHYENLGNLGEKNVT